MLSATKTPHPDMETLLRERKIRALLFDLDGVITQTAKLHAAAWKKMFDEFLQNAMQNGQKSQSPFSIEHDYPKYLDGISRIQGIQNFLLSRNIEIPLGLPEDAFEAKTVWGLGNHKNAYYQQLLQTQGAEVFPDAVAWIEAKRETGFQTAIISASKNCREVLKIAGLENLFEVQVDGLKAEEKHLKTKPAPDIFLEAARALAVQPEFCAVFEDARAGVEAGKAGHFGLVAGVNRNDPSEAKALLQSGADLVITQFPAQE